MRGDPLTNAEWQKVLDAAAKLFPPYNEYGVFAYGLGRRRVRGRDTTERTLLVYVATKRAAPKHPVPTIKIRRGAQWREIVPDVIATGRRARATADVQAPDFTGIHPGAAILADGAVRQYGGVACLLGGASGPTHLLTAGHLFAPGERGADVVAADDIGSAPRTIGSLAVNLLDRPYGWMKHAIDAAVVELNDDGIAMAERHRDDHPGPQLVDFVPTSSAGDQPVLEFLPTSCDYSRRGRTLPDPVYAHLSSEARGTYAVTAVLGTDRPLGDGYGDSGTILCTGPGHRYAIGISIGRLDAMSLFEPIGRAIAAARKALKAPRLAIWS